MGGRGEIAPRTALKVLVGYWTAFTLLFLMRSYTETWASRLASLARRVPLAILGALICWLMATILQRVDPRSAMARLVWVLALSVPAGIMFAAVNAVGLYLISPVAGEGCGYGAPCTVDFATALAVEYSVNFIFVFAAWGLLYLGMRDAADAVAAERRVSKARDAARLAELRALRYQVNPHFLFNSLNSLGTLVDRGDAAAAREMIGEMSAFLRYGLASDPVADVELEEEIEMERRYLEVERWRFGKRLVVRIEVADQVRRARVPALILQPLVENAIKHGVASTSAPVTVAITARLTPGGELSLTVEDDASPPQAQEQGGGVGVGLRNVSERLDARFGSAARLEAGPGNAGYKASLLMPFETA